MWNPIWHQAITRSFLDGKAFGWGKTIVFSVHTPVDGMKIRFRFSNRLGSEPYEIGQMAVLSEGKSYPVTLEGKTAFSIPTGGCTFSDEIPVPVLADSDLEIRMYYTSRIIDSNMIEAGASLLPGNQVEASSLRFGKPILARLMGVYNAIPGLDLVEVFSEEETTRSIVAFGDSITALSKWTKPLSERLENAFGGAYVLLNSGISGNCLLYEPEGLFGPVFGEMGTKRFARDVLEIPNLYAVIFGLGVNDVSYYTEQTKDVICLENYRKAVEEMAKALHERGVRVIMQTISPRLGVAPTMGKYTRAMEEQRLLFNEWIRSEAEKPSGLFDYCFDAEAVVREEHPDGYYYGKGLHMGDRLHPNARGGRMLAEAFDLGALTGEEALRV